MYVNDRYKTEVLNVVLENGVDFTPQNCRKFLTNTFEIKEDKLNSIAKEIGFDECTRCGKLTSINQDYVNATFIRYKR